MAEKIDIKLPVDSNGNPDWEYIEKYVELLEIKIKQNIFKRLGFDNN